MRDNRSRRSNLGTVLLLAAGSAALIAPAAEATNGYLIHGVGTRAKAMAGAGVALPLDALSAGTNPASAVWVGKRYDAGLAYFSPKRSYTVSGEPSQFPGTFGLVPGTVESDSEEFFIPNFGGNWEIGENAAFGIALYGQGGMNTDYPTSTFFGSSPTGVDLSQLFIVPTYSRKMGELHSFGISPIIAYQHVRGERARGVSAPSVSRAIQTSLTNNGSDDSIGYGFKIGYLGSMDRQRLFRPRLPEQDLDGGVRQLRRPLRRPGRLRHPLKLRRRSWRSRSATPRSWRSISRRSCTPTSTAVSLPLLPNLLQDRPSGHPTAAPASAGRTCRSSRSATSGAPATGSGGSATPPATSRSRDSEVIFNILAPGVMEDHITFGFSKENASGGAFSMALTHAPSVKVSGPNPLEVPGLQTIELEMEQWDLEFGFSWGGN